MDTGASLSSEAGKTDYTTAEVDDVGAWGGVLKLGGFTTPANVLSVSGHAVTIGTSGYGFTSIANNEQFAVTALRFQVDEGTSGNQFVTFANDTKDSSNIAASDIDLTGTVDLTGTGVYGLTRDNDISSDGSMTKCVYGGAFGNANTAKTITFDTGTIYRHRYNGLFAKLDGGTVQNVTFAGTINVNAKTDMYVGAAAARAAGAFHASKVTVSTAMPYSGSSNLYMGGILGEADGSIGRIDVSNCSVAANITGGCDKAVIGGVIGQISHNSDEGRSWNFSTVNVSGEITNTASGKIGGLVSVINGSYNGNSAHRVLTLSGITVDGLTVSGSDADSMGGLLGYSWLKTDVNVTSVTVQDNSSDSSKIPTVSNSGAGGIGGMVYRATGKWTVTSLDIKDIAVSGSGSVGMIVNKGISNDGAAFYTNGSRSAIYLCLPSGYTYNITSATLPSVSVFDELCAYTAPDAVNVLRNGNGVISINTTFKTDGSTASGSYHAQTANGASANPNSRYYYNLDTVTANSSSDAILTYNESTNPNAYKNQLMSWGLNQYACTNLQQYFADVFGGTISDHEYDMKDYSWYPVDLDKNITVNGTFKFYSHEFELSEDVKAGNETNSFDRTNLENNQHYTMHCGLFRNVASGKTLTIGTTAFKGDVGLLEGGSGALICGTVQGASNTSKATVQVSDSGSISLNGVYVYDVIADDPSTASTDESNYAPLLINNVGSYVNLTIKNVTSTGYRKASYSTNSPYLSKDGSDYPKAASSLIGDVGLSDSPTGINVNFSNIKLDGRTVAVSNSTYNTELNTVYGSDLTIFTRSTLLNQFKYASGSTGTYNYTSDEDWSNSSHAGLGVTYGKEVGYTAADTNTEYGGKEQKYSGSSYYTNPVAAASESAYTGFGNFLPYVFTAYNKSNNTHPLRVNHAASTATGCGTYNDPYILSSGEKLEKFCYQINTGNFTNDTKISIPTDSLSKSGSAITIIGGTWCNEKSSHAEFTSNGAQFSGTISGTTYTISFEVMRTYLAGAYYEIPDEISEITIASADFEGLGNTSDDYAVFRGVIDGNNRKIINKTGFPLIESSNGSVIKNLTIEATPTETITENGTNTAFSSAKSEDNNAAYGAVIAKTLGGDNIIDNVSVSLGTESNNMNIALTGNYAQLVPVGGYVGVVVNGGLIFRNMSRVDGNNNALTYDESLFSNVSISAANNANKSPQTAISDDNRAWLYVNPIVGRVINGYAVTESDKYRPYEDGTRTYQGGTTDEVRYWDEDSQTEVTTKPSSLSHVTMQNGTKHYSIADIDDELTKLSASGSTITVPNGQAWFVMSLLVNSGVSADNLGFKQNYQMSRQAKYTDIGASGSSSDCGDYNTLAKDDKLTNSKSTKKGYLYNAYYLNTVQLHNTPRTVDLSNVTYYLPDGYKGLGNIFQNADNYRMKISTLNGNGAAISQNTEFYYYFKKNGDNSDVFDSAQNSSKKNIYTPPENVGIGLINYQNQTLVANDLTFTGNVIVDTVDSSSSTGEHTPYSAQLSDWKDVSQGFNAGIGRKEMAAVGSFIGFMSEKITVTDIALDNIYVHGLKTSGGLIGVISGKDTVITNTNTNSQKIKVHGAAITGGLIGRKNNNDLTIDFNNTQFDITEVVCECTKNVSSTYDANYGVGGLIGCTRSRTGNEDSTGTQKLNNINIGSSTQSSAIKIKCENAEIFTGGLVGLVDRTTLEINNCHVFNLELSSKYYSGGLLGHISTSPNERRNSVATMTNGGELKITGVSLEKSINYNSVPFINSTGKSSGGFIGAVKNDLHADLVMSECYISGYYYYRITLFRRCYWCIWVYFQRRQC